MKHVESINQHTLDKHHTVVQPNESKSKKSGGSKPLNQTKLDNKALQMTFNLPSNQTLTIGSFCVQSVAFRF